LYALFILAVLALAGKCSAAEKWTRAVVADEVAITVHVVSIEELNHKRGGLVVMGSVRAAAHGYAVLYRAHSGELKCNVYVTREPTAETLEHEARHCHGWTHK
jgi:lactate dehydrogenase-like 2-hydroxyacid dehydrogenase